MSFTEGDYGIGWVVIRAGVKIRTAAVNSTLMPFGGRDNIDNPHYDKNGPDKHRKIIDWTKRNKTQVTIAVTDNNGNTVPNYPYQTHRQGVSADISNQALQSNGGLFPLTEDQMKRCLRLVIKKPRVGSEPGHFHVTIR